MAELDNLAARLIDGRINGSPVEDAIDLDRIEAAVREILTAIGEDPDRPGLKETPRRVARAYAELFAGLRVDPALVLKTSFDENHNELVLVREIEVQSFCEHHLLPFTGVAHVGYLPADRILGLSKLARVIELFARRLQVQERLTTQVADWLQAHLEPKGVGVVLEAEHLCMSLRGVRAAGARTVTSALHGLLRTDADSRQEFLAFAGISR
jgi:GTP cyclohydrolase I